MLTRRSTEARRRIDEWTDVIRQQMKAHPGRSVALALGAGYVLGGGLFSALTARLLGAGVRFGLRVALVPMVTQSIASLGEGLMGRGSRSDSGDSDDSDDSDHSSAQNSAAHIKHATPDHKEKES